MHFEHKKDKTLLITVGVLAGLLVLNSAHMLRCSYKRKHGGLHGKMEQIQRQFERLLEHS